MSNNIDDLQFDVPTIDDLKAGSKELSRGKGKFYKPKQGVNRVRLLAAPPGKRSYIIYHQHDFHTEDGKYRPFTCPAMNTQGRAECPECEYGQRLEDLGTARDREEAEKCKTKVQIMVNVIDRDDEDAGPQVWRVPQGVWAVVDADSKAYPGESPFSMLAAGGGRDLHFTCKGTGLQTRYTPVSFDRKAKDAATKADGKPDNAKMSLWLKEQYDLGKYAVIKSADEIVTLTGRSPSSLPVPATSSRQLTGATRAGGEWNENPDPEAAGDGFPGATSDDQPF